MTPRQLLRSRSFQATAAQRAVDHDGILVRAWHAAATSVPHLPATRLMKVLAGP